MSNSNKHVIQPMMQHNNWSNGRNIQALMTQSAWADMHMAQTWPLPWKREEEEELREEILSSFFWKHSEKMREMEDRQNKDRRKSRFKMRDKHKTNSTEQTYLRWNWTLTSRFARAFFRTSRVRDTGRQTSSLKLWWHHNTKTHHHMSKLNLINLKLLKQIKHGLGVIFMNIMLWFQIGLCNRSNFIFDFDFQWLWKKDSWDEMIVPHSISQLFFNFVICYKSSAGCFPSQQSAFIPPKCPNVIVVKCSLLLLKY